MDKKQDSVEDKDNNPQSTINCQLKLSHLQELEAESIHIIREVAAEFENPVMLYSIGKDSSVMVRLAEKAFAPGKVPFPLMHIDSKWKFREMVEFRDAYAKKFGWNLIVESNMEAYRAGVGPFTHGSKVHTDLMKTQALLQALDKHKFDAAFGGARRDEEKSRAKERIFSFRDKFHQWDPKNQRPFTDTNAGTRHGIKSRHWTVRRQNLLVTPRDHVDFGRAVCGPVPGDPACGPAGRPGSSGHWREHRSDSRRILRCDKIRALSRAGIDVE